MQKIIKGSNVRRIVILSLVLCMICCSVFVTPAYAWSNPGASTFGPGLDQFGGELEFEDNNGWTSVKTLQGWGQADEFWLNGYFRKADNYNGLIKLTVKVKRVSDGAIICNKVFYPNSDGSGNFNTGRIRVNSTEEKVQFFFDASTYNATPPGPYRKAYVSYDLCFV